MSFLTGSGAFSSMNNNEYHSQILVGLEFDFLGYHLFSSEIQ